MAINIDKYGLSRKYDRRCKTTDEDVASMRKLYFAGVSQKTIGEMFGISQSAVSYNVSRHSRATLAKYRKEKPSKGRDREEDTSYRRALRAYKKGIFMREIDEMLERKKNEEVECHADK